MPRRSVLPSARFAALGLLGLLSGTDDEHVELDAWFGEAARRLKAPGPEALKSDGLSNWAARFAALGLLSLIHI